MTRKCNLLLCTALLWLVLLHPARATVLLYKGIGTLFTPTAAGYSASEGCYLILDLNAGEMTLIYYDTFNRKKSYWIPVNQESFDNTPITASGNKTYQIFADVSRQSEGGGYADQAAIFRGLNVTVNIGGSPGNYSTGTYPRSLSGIYRYLGFGLGSSYDEHSFSLTFDQTDTVNSNNGSLGIVDVQANIVGILETAGYQ